MAIANQSSVAGAIVFGTGTTEKMRMASNGFFGIGISNPSFPLEVSSTSTTLLARFTSNQANAAIRIVNSSSNGGRTYSIGSGDTTSAAGNNFYIYDETNGALRFAINNSGFTGMGTSNPQSMLHLDTSSGNGCAIRMSSTSANGRVYAIGSNFVTGTGEFAIYDYTAGAERMRINSSGNVLIGINSSAYKLDVTSADAYTTRFNSTAAQGGFTAWANSGTAYGYAGNAYHIVVGGSVGDMALTSVSNLVFASGSGLTERMRITSGGNVGIGNTGDPDIRLFVKGQNSTSSQFALLLQNSNANNLFYVRNDYAVFAPGIYSFTTGSGANVVVFSDGSMQRSTSSLKYKNNIQDYTKGLNEVMQLRPVTYESKNPREEGVTFAGLIAEEVHDLGLTEFVQYAEDGTPDALAYSNMVALLVKSIQELEARLKTLENK
jgi:hypothetical protein